MSVKLNGKESRPVYTLASPSVYDRNEKFLGKTWKWAFGNKSHITSSLDVVNREININVHELDVNQEASDTIDELLTKSFIINDFSGSLTGHAKLDQTLAEVEEYLATGSGMTYVNPVLPYNVESTTTPTYDNKIISFYNEIDETFAHVSAIIISHTDAKNINHVGRSPFRSTDLSLPMFVAVRQNPTNNTIYQVVSTTPQATYTELNCLYYSGLVSSITPFISSTIQVEFLSSSMFIPTSGSFAVDTSIIATVESVTNFSSSIDTRINNININNINFSGSVAQEVNLLSASICDDLFGDGSDGDLVLTNPITLSRDMYWHNLKIAGVAMSGSVGLINTNGYIIHVNNILDLTTADTGSGIKNNGNYGFSAGDGYVGVGGLGAPGHTVGAGGNGGNGGEPCANVSPWTLALPPQQTNISPANGGSGGIGGNNDRWNVGGDLALTGSLCQYPNYIRRATSILTGKDFQLIRGGGGGSGGNGGPDVITPAYAGAGGGGGGTLAIYARFIKSSGAIVNCITALGGSGGHSYSNDLGTSSYGAGAGGGGGGGFVYICMQAKLDALNANTINASGGIGGNSTSSLGWTTDEGGGKGGNGGTIIVVQLDACSGSIYQGGTGLVNVGRYGGSGSICVAPL